MTNEFKLKSVGLDTTNLNYYIPSDYRFYAETEDYSYYYTNVSSNNGGIVKTILPDNTAPGEDASKLVVGVDYLDGISKSLPEHLEEMGRTSADILLVDAKCDIDKYFDEIKFLVDSRFVEYVGLKNPEVLDVKRLEELRILLDINFIGINVSPLYYNAEVMNWAREHDIVIMGFNPFGGYLSYNLLINAFSMMYLLKFAADKSDIVMLSGRDLYAADTNRGYLNSLIGKDKGDTSYVVKKTIDKLVKPLKTIGHVSLKTMGGLFYINDPEVMFNDDEVQINLGKPLEKIEELTSADDLTIEVSNFLKEVKVPEDAKTSGDIISVARPLVLEMVRERLKDEGWECSSAFYGDIYVISAVREFRIKRWFSRDKVTLETKSYILYWSEKNGFVFRNVQNSTAVSSES